MPAALMKLEAASSETIDATRAGAGARGRDLAGCRRLLPRRSGRPGAGRQHRRVPGRRRSGARRQAGPGRSRAGVDERQLRARRGYTVARGEAAASAIWSMRKKSVGPARQHAGRAAPGAVRRGHGRAAGAPGRLHRRVPRACSTGAASSTACSATSTPAACTCARRST